jgi:RNA recognition motif-containing protein
VLSTRVMKDLHTGLSKGYAFVNMATQEQAQMVTNKYRLSLSPPFGSIGFIICTIPYNLAIGNLSIKWLSDGSQILKGNI